MSSVRAAAVKLSCCILFVLVVPPCRGQAVSGGQTERGSPAARGSDCSCDVTNSRCDESGVCRCDPGWEGDRCDRCVVMPGCRHGNCQQPWQCSCDPGWGGRFCDKDLSVCSQQPCQNGGTCLMELSGDYSCQCPEGFHGNHCQLRTGPCHLRRSPCKNGGQCEDADGFAEALSCRCLAGFTGPRCETDVDDCLMRPCANGATCLDGINRFSCLCPAGFSGRFCSVNLDDCASQPCLHGGRCLDRPGGFLCVCPRGFAGDTCQTELRVREPGGDSTTRGKSQRSGTTGNSSRHGNRLFKVTVSERRAAGLWDVQLSVLLVLAGVTLGAVVLTGTLVLQGHCRTSHAPCWPMTSSSERRVRRGEAEGQISFLNTDPEKKVMTH